MANYEFDLAVLGGGSGGVALARRAASHGARVVLFEHVRLGGTCVHRGCVPKKLLSYAASFPYEFEIAAGYGFTPPQSEFSWPALIAAKDAELDRLLGFYTRSVEGSGVTHVSERGVFVAPHTLRGGERTVTAQHICIAVGGRAFVPEMAGREHALTSDDVFALRQLPKRWVVQGSGYIGVEFASIFRGLGCEVDLVFRSPQPLPGFDGDLRASLREEMERRGVRFHVETELRSLHADHVETSRGRLDCDAILCATGRVPNTADLNLEAVGVKLGKRGEVLINDDRETSTPGIYALGDCTDRVQLTPYAIAEGRQLGDRLFAGKRSQLPGDVPTAVFALPPAATVGDSEEQARQKYGEDVEIYRTRFRPMRFTLPKKEEKVMMKLVVRRSDQRVLGVHMVGAEAPEIIQALAVALTCQATKSQFDQTLAVHPTVGEEFVLLREPVKA